MMDQRYSDWIEQNVQDAYGACKEITEQMAVVFPELQRVRGHYYCPIWGERGHWWLKTVDGQIIDPTVSQFPSKGVGVYDEWDESRQEPTGMCPNCGEYCYEGKYCCSENCHIEYAAYCMNPIN